MTEGFASIRFDFDARRWDGQLITRFRKWGFFFGFGCLARDVVGLFSRKALRDMFIADHYFRLGLLSGRELFSA